jgi:hypothetical protein
MTSEEQNLDAEVTPVGDLEARVIRGTRVYEAKADHDALLREYAQAIDTGTKAATLVRAKLDIEIAKDQLTNLYSLRNATASLIDSSHRLEGLTRWLAVDVGTSCSYGRAGDPDGRPGLWRGPASHRQPRRSWPRVSETP